MSLFRKHIRLGLAAVALVLFASACGSDDGPIASVGSSTLDRSELSDNSVEDRAVVSSLITGWVRNELFFAEMAETGYTPAESFFTDSRAELEDLRLSDPTLPDPDTLEGEIAVRGNALGPIIADFLVAEGFEIAAQEELCSSHILVDTEEEAIDIIARLEGGEDFATLAMELSTGPSGPAGGDLGCIDPRTFVVEFVDGARAVDAPGVSAPTQSEFGWHVIDVLSFDTEPVTDPDAILNAVLASQEFLDLQDAAIAQEVTLDPQFGEWNQADAQVIS